MKVCKRGHQFRGDENYRARRGWCPVCFQEVRARYRKTAKAEATRQRYESTEKAAARHSRYRETDKRADSLARYDQSPKGWLNVLRKRRKSALERLANRATN